MKFIFLTYDGHGLPIAYKLQKEGHDVIVAQIENVNYMPKEEEEEKRRRLMLYEGMLEKINADKVIEILDKERDKKQYFVFSDFNYTWLYAEKFKKMGFVGILPTKEDFYFEQDRNKSKEIIEKYYDIFAQEEAEEFKKIEEAKQFLKERKDKIWGIKGFNPDAPTFFSDSNNPNIAIEETIDTLEKNKEVYESQGFILEEKIEDLIEFVPEIIAFDNKILGLSIDIELKHYGADNTSFQTGCSADMVFWLEPDKWQKFINLFFPVEDFYLRKNELVIWDAGVMYSPSRNNFYFSEFCSNRPGYNSFFTELSTFNRIEDFFYKVINKMPLFDDYVFKYGTSVRVFNNLKEKEEGKKHLTMSDVLIIADSNDKNIWLWDVYQKNGRLYTVGYDYNLAVLTMASEDWKINFLMLDKILKNNKKFCFSTGYYRTANDILGTHYWGNLEQRFDFVNKYFGLQLEQGMVKTFEKYENKINEIINKSLAEKQVINELDKILDKFKDV